MWIRDLEKEMLIELLQEGVCQFLAAGLDGEIFWVSDAFLDWSGYTNSELRKLGWIRLSVDDENLDADKVAAADMKAGLITRYKVTKKYQIKSGPACWGTLTVRRIPTKGEFRFAWCHWAPKTDETSENFESIKALADKLEASVGRVGASVDTLATRTGEEKWVASSIEMIQKHPRIATMLLVIVLTLFGLNNVLEILQRTGLIRVPVSLEVKDPVTGQMIPATKEQVDSVRDLQNYIVTGDLDSLHIRALYGSEIKRRDGI